MSVTVDVNVLVYASNQGDPAHEHATEVIERLAQGPDVVYLFWPVLLGYLRIVTHPAILPRPLAPTRAQANVRQLLDRPHVRAPGEQPGFWSVLEDTTGGLSRGNDFPDAHLAALMRQHGVRTIHTRDRGFRRFRGIEVVELFA